MSNSDIARHIRTLDIWTDPPLIEEDDATISDEMDKVMLRIRQKKDAAISELDQSLKQVVAHFDQQWSYYDKISKQAGYPVITGVSECDELFQYTKVCERLKLGREGQDVLCQMDLIEGCVKSKEYHQVLQLLQSVNERISTLDLPGLKKHVNEQVISLAEATKMIISKDLLASETPLSYRATVDLLSLDRELDTKVLGRQKKQKYIDSVAHALWFKIEKWKLASPPDLRWLELEGCNTASSIYMSWSTSRKTEESEIENDLAESGLKELFFRYLSYRAEEDILYRVRDFARDVIAVAAVDKSLQTPWRHMCRRALRQAWRDAVPMKELVHRADDDREKLTNQLVNHKADDEDAETCPINGVDVQISTIVAMTLVEELVDRVSITLDEAERMIYLDATLDHGVIKIIIDHLKQQWNDLDDPLKGQNIPLAIVIFNSVSHIYRVLNSLRPLVDKKTIEPVLATRRRILQLLENELTIPPGADEEEIRRIKLEHPVMSRFLNETVAEDREELLLAGGS